jgi:ketosteroid isomerase-like protein
MTANIDVVNRAYSAFASGDIAALLDTLSDDVEWSSPTTLPHGGEFSGRDDVLTFFQGIGAMWDSLDVAVEAIGEAGDDLVLAVVWASGTRKGGEAAGYGAAHAFEVRDGSIIRFREYVDLDEPLDA